jgi:hypothetical protein
MAHIQLATRYGGLALVAAEPKAGDGGFAPRWNEKAERSVASLPVRPC